MPNWNEVLLQLVAVSHKCHFYAGFLPPDSPLGTELRRAQEETAMLKDSLADAIQARIECLDQGAEPVSKAESDWYNRIRVSHHPEAPG